jgi:hypothetical protein
MFTLGQLIGSHVKVYLLILYQAGSYTDRGDQIAPSRITIIWVSL